MYDVLILGGGPAGCTAALYCGRAGLSCVVMEGNGGGQMALSVQIENYPGIPVADGSTLAGIMRAQAENAGAEFIPGKARRVSLHGKIKTADDICARTAILATGASPRRLNLPGEQNLVGRGISYCAACDGAFFRGRRVAVIGGGNTAVSDVLYFSGLCSEVHLIHRRGSLHAAAAGQSTLCSLPNLHIHWNCRACELVGGEFLQGLVLENTENGRKERLTLDGIFVAIGRAPETALFRGILETDADGYLLAEESTHTAIPGVFAAGDVRKKPVRQIVTAAADGAVAALAAERYLAERRNEI